MNFSEKYIQETLQITSLIDPSLVEEMAEAISNLKKRDGRLFLLGQVEVLVMQAMQFVI